MALEGGTNGRGCKSNLLHDFWGVFHVDFPETIPNNVTMFIFPNLDITASIGRVFVGKQIEKVFVVNFDEGALDIEIPSTGSFLAKLPCTGKYGCYGPRDDAHTVLRIGGVGVEVDTSHCVRFSRTGLSVCEDGAVEALQEPRDERVRRGGKDSMLGCRRTVNLIKSELLFLRGDGLSWGRG